jgi:hypothetical protein
MKIIPETGRDAKWDDKLLNELVFIKKHLRYPFSRKTLPSVLFLTGLLFLFLRMLWVMVFISNKLKVAAWWLLLGVLVLIVAISLYQYMQVLRFKVIATPYAVAENMKLVNDFLLSQQLAIYQLPGAPEVSQIASRPVGYGKHEQQEVMIFIADDKRILINSHFTKTKFMEPPSRNSKKMAKMLNQWIQGKYKNENIVIQKVN